MGAGKVVQWVESERGVGSRGGRAVGEMKARSEGEVQNRRGSAAPTRENSPTLSVPLCTLILGHPKHENTL